MVVGRCGVNHVIMRSAHPWDDSSTHEQYQKQPLLTSTTRLRANIPEFGHNNRHRSKTTVLIERIDLGMVLNVALKSIQHIDSSALKVKTPVCFYLQCKGISKARVHAQPNAGVSSYNLPSNIVCRARSRLFRELIVQKLGHFSTLW